MCQRFLYWGNRGKESTGLGADVMVLCPVLTLIGMGGRVWLQMPKLKFDYGHAIFHCVYSI